MGRLEFAKSHKSLFGLLCRAAYMGCRVRSKIKGDRNEVVSSLGLMKGTQIKIAGSGNTIIVGDYSYLEGVSFSISGSDNTIVIGDDCHCVDTVFHIEDSGNSIVVGSGTKMLGRSHFAVMESTRIVIGDDSLFSSDVHFRTGDSHSIVNLDGKRINWSEDIEVGDHVWIGMRAVCLKGARIPSNSVVAASALVSGSFDEENVVLAGIPARVVKRDVNWDAKRIDDWASAC